MIRQGAVSRHLRLVVAAALTTPVVVTLASAPTHAALGGLTPFEIDSNTTPESGTDWASKFAAGQVAVSNDTNFTGEAVVQTDVGSSTTAPSWLPNCPSSNFDTVFTTGSAIDDPNWVGDVEPHPVSDKDDICQSYFSYDVVETGPRAGHIVSYIALTRPVFKGDGNYHFVLSKGPNPDIRVAGDIVIEVEYDNQGAAQGLRVAQWSDPGPTLGAVTDVGVNNANVELTPLGYFAEVAIDLTALDLVPNVNDLPTPESCLAFGFGRVISRVGNSASASLKDDGRPVALDFDVCGGLVIRKQLTAAVPETARFPVTVSPPTGVTLPYPDPILEVLGGTLNGGTPVDGNADPSPNQTPIGNPVRYEVLPSRPSGGYNVWEPLAGELGVRWHRDSIVCVNNKATSATGDDVTTIIDDPSDVFQLLTFETVTCTITNSPAPAVINVDKRASGRPGTWPVNLSGASSGSVGVSDDGTNDFSTPASFETFGSRAAGSYTLIEGAEAAGGAFRASGWSCIVEGGSTTTAPGAAIRFDANPGDVVDCTITNAPVAPPDVRVEKTAAPISFPETATAAGSPVVYTVAVHNDGAEPFTITNLTDAVDGGSAFDLDAAAVGSEAGLAGATIVANSCNTVIGEPVGGGTSHSCEFSVSYTGRNAGDVIGDQVTAFVVDAFNRAVSQSSEASVEVTDVPPVITVDKQNVLVNGTTAVVAPGGPARYSITITNGPHAIEPITLTSVNEMLTTDGGGFAPTAIDYFTVGGPVTTTTCSNSVGTVLDPDESVSCEFTIDTTLVGPLTEGDELTNRVAVTADDDDGVGTVVVGSAEASRIVRGELPTFGVFKTDNDAQIPEPGASIAYDVTIANLSVSEPLIITSITDDVFFIPRGGAKTARGSLVINGGGVNAASLNSVSFVATDCAATIGTTLAVNDGIAGGPDEATCTITLTLVGNAGDAYHDVVTVTGKDDEGTPAEPVQNEADTPVVDTPPVITIDKSDNQPNGVPETGGQVVYTLLIKNESASSDPVTITSLSDSQFGTFFPATRQHDMDSTTCFTLAGVPLQPGESTSCVIVATLRGQSGETHVNRATIGAEDDEGTPATAFADDTVAFNKVLPTIKVSKAAFPTTVPESGGTVTFAVAIENTSLEPVTVTSLVDSVDGGPPVDLTTLPGTCIAGAELKPGVTYTCLFTRTVVQTDGAPSETDVASAAVVDDDGDVAVGGAPAIVTFELIPPTVNIVQTDANFTVNEPGGDVTYALLITNTSFEPETVTSLSNPISYEVPDTDIIIDLLSQERAPLSKFECRDANHALINLATYRIAPAETVTCTFVLTLSGTAQIVRGDVRVTVVDDDGQHGADEDEEATPILDVAPEVDIVKTASPTVIDFGDTVTYTFTISNVKDVEPIRVLTLNDDTFGEIFDECVDTGGMATLLAPNDHLPGGADETTCTIERVLTETPGTTHVNTATVTAADDEIIADPLLLPVFDFDSAAVRTLTPNTSVVKTVTATPARDATGLWTVVYSIELTNTGPGTDVVDVEDTFSFGAGVDVQAAAVTGPPGVTLNPGFDGAGDPMIADDAVIAAETTQTYTITVTARIDDAVLGENAGTCDAEGVSAGGFLNSVTLTSTATGEVDSDFACAPFSTLTLVKNLSNNDGGNATLADFILTAAANGITYVSGTGTVTEAVPAGTYSLAETTKAGYTASASGFTCTTEQTGSSVRVASASEVTCMLSNDDQALDLQLTQSDGGFTGTSGQQPPFPYTIAVRNLGPRDVDNEPVTVVDDLPVAFEWVAPAPAGCAIAGQKLTCDVAPASLRPAGTTVTITATARLKAGATAGPYDNRAYVTTQDDSVTAPPSCTEAAAVAADNNVDCESTPVTAGAQVPPTLPPTGSNSTTPVTWSAIMLVLLGGMVTLVSRRRRTGS